jgi:hypothetical protein
MNKTLEEVLRWLKSHHENSTFVLREQRDKLFPWPTDIRSWCQKHQLNAEATEHGWKITNDKS